MTRPTIRDVITAAAEHYDLHATHIIGPRTDKRIVRARHHAMYVAWNRCWQASLTQIGREFRRDHTTVLYAVRKVKMRIESMDAQCIAETESIAELVDKSAPAHPCLSDYYALM